MYVAYTQPNGGTDWAKFFVDTHEWPEAKKIEKNVS